ncbi:hypothetical protein [Pseudomonas sp. GM_Psu_2]|uniref:hypothetical protein n=1 Tax=unclassified Pseudomonas TaxID=196821 RepID=UPI002269F64D|nr:hypothetical protein [Pseudomonas sp. GM_Psu_2]
MARRALSIAPPPQLSEATTTYQVWLTPKTLADVEAAFAEYQAGSWADWVRLALTRLQRESEPEQRSLFGGVKRNPREGKELLSFRVYQSDLEAFKLLAQRHNSNVQSVLATAFFMQALAPADLPTSLVG